MGNPSGRLPGLAGLSDDELRQVRAAGREVTVPDGWSLIAQSTPPDKAYLVIEGRLAVLAAGEQVAELGPGDLVGEIGLRERKLRTATVTARTPLKLLHFTPEAFSELCARVPAFRAAVDSTVASRTGSKTG
ncbi:MAG: cyclic nucleotide-binding domain-containing protein [Streptosporangiales bacterium]